jgi:hypothetical protein
MNLKGKKILLLMPHFFNYSTLLINELEHRGAVVEFVENKIQRFDPASPQCKMRFLRKIYYDLFSVRWRYLKKLIHTKVSYDIFLCINGFSFDGKLVQELRDTNPDIQCVLYLWDSTKMYDWGGITSYFDKNFSFDPLDAQQLGISYLANFYPKDVELTNATLTKDVFFIGSQHADRFDVLKKIVTHIKAVSDYEIHLLIKYRTILHSKFLYFLFKHSTINYAINFVKNYELIERKIKFDFLIYSPVSPEIVQNMMEHSRCVLDIQAPTQVGLPHQLVLALGMGKKIITTNDWIKNFDFYDSKQILIINRENPIIPISFLKTDLPILKLPESILDSRIDNWVSKILFYK